MDFNALNNLGLKILELNIHRFEKHIFLCRY